MIIENATWKFYAPDTASILDPKTWIYTLDSTKLVPYDLYILKEELKLKQSELSSITITDNDLLIWAKQNYPDLQNKTAIQSNIDTLTLEIKNFI